MSWLSKALKNKYVSNALKNFAPVAGALTGGLGGIAIGALGSAAGNATGRHPSLGGMIKGGITGGLEAYGGSKALGALKGAFAPSSAAFQSAVPMAKNVAIEAAAPNTANIVTAADVAGPSLISRAGNFIEKNPNTAAMAMKGAGDVFGGGAEDELARAQARRLQQQTLDDEYEAKRKRERDLALEPLRRALMGQLGNSGMSIAPNPYR